MEIKWIMRADKVLVFEIFGASEAEQALLQLCEYNCPCLDYDKSNKSLSFTVDTNRS